jgi:hypothetical protein
MQYFKNTSIASTVILALPIKLTDADFSSACKN